MYINHRQAAQSLRDNLDDWTIHDMKFELNAGMNRRQFHRRFRDCTKYQKTIDCLYEMLCTEMCIYIKP